MPDDHRQVWVTGAGAVSCLGTGVSALWHALLAGRIGLRRIERIDLEGSPYTVGGEALDSAPPRVEQSGISLGALFAEQACREAAVDLTGEDLSHIALVLASNFGPSEVVGSLLDGRFQPPRCSGVACRLHDGPFQWDLDCVGSALGIGGQRAAISLSCSSGTAAIAYALDMIRTGCAELALAAGYDSIQKTVWAGLASLRVMTAGAGGEQPQVRPFDRARSGTLFSEGAGALLLESESHARARGADPLAVVAGAFANNNAYHMTHADEDGRAMSEAISMALTDGGIDPASVRHVNAHGTGTKLNDVTEARALETVFGSRTGKVAITSVKGGLGHAMGAAGSLEAIATVLSVKHGLIPPTVNHEDLDPECGELDVVVGEPRALPRGPAVNNSAGIGGGNAAVVFAPVD